MKLGGKSTLLFEFDDGDAAAALLGRSGLKMRDELMVVQELGNRAPKLTTYRSP